MAKLNLPLPATFALLWVFSAIELGLMADIVDYFHDESIVPQWIKRRASYALFVAVFSFLAATAWLILHHARRFALRWLYTLALAILIFIFWIIAAGLIEDAFTDIPYRQCSFIFGKGKCRELRVARGFAWMLVVTSLALIPLALLFGRRAERDTVRTGPADTAPAAGTKTTTTPHKDAKVTAPAAPATATV